MLVYYLKFDMSLPRKNIVKEIYNISFLYCSRMDNEVLY